MPYYRRRRLQDIDVNLIKKVSHQYHKDRTGHYGFLGAPLTNYKVPKPSKPIAPQTPGNIYGNKILYKDMARFRNPRGYGFKAPRYGSYTKKRKTVRRRRLTPLAIPSSKVVRFRAVASYALTSTTGTLAMTPVKANSLNDPTGGFSALLPGSMDQWAAMYEKYIVLGSKITVRFTAITQTGPGMVGIHLADKNTGPTTVGHYRELPLTKVKVISPQRDQATIVMKYAGKRFWKLSGIKDDSEQEGAFSTSPGDPTDIAYFQVFLQDMVGGSTFAADAWLEIEYVCLLTNPVQVAQSSL